jgi:predicted double-glycine peptidase
MQDYNFVCGSVWVWNLVTNMKGETQTEGVWERGAEEYTSTWTKEGWNDCMVEKLA